MTNDSYHEINWIGFDFELYKLVCCHYVLLDTGHLIALNRLNDLVIWQLIFVEYILLLNFGLSWICLLYGAKVFLTHHSPPP